MRVLSSKLEFDNSLCVRLAAGCELPFVFDVCFSFSMVSFEKCCLIVVFAADFELAIVNLYRFVH